MNDNELLKKLEDFTQQQIKKYHKSGKAYLLDTKTSEAGFKIGCVLISGDKHAYDLYDMTRRKYIYRDIYNKPLAIAIAIDYNRQNRSSVELALSYDHRFKSIWFEIQHLKQLMHKNANPVKQNIYEVKKQEAKARLHTCEKLIQAHFRKCNLHK